MDIRAEPFYFFSIELASSSLPGRAKFIRRLRATGGDLTREVALIELEKPDEAYPPRYLVIIPRHAGKSFFSASADDAIFVNVFNGKALAASDSIDLADGDLELLDVAGVARTEREARKWQVVLPDPPRQTRNP